MRFVRATLSLVAASLLGGPPVHAADLRPVVAIIIDDMGDRRAEGLDLLEIDAPLAFAFLPHTPYAASLARIAHQLGREVILHLPMESRSGARLGPGGLTVDMSRPQLTRIVSTALDAVPHVSGVSNHMGSLLTPRRAPMTWLMGLLAARGNLFFLDSQTDPGSVALEIAREHGLRAVRRDVFLDNDRSHAAITAQLEVAIALAREFGTAVAIGHPYRETAEVLSREISRLGPIGIRLAPLNTLIGLRRDGREPTHSPTLPVLQSSSRGQAASTM